jgi:para-nitrobenzyl esterase
MTGSTTRPPAVSYTARPGPAAETADPEVTTGRGRVLGSSSGGVAVFRGIPYAEPPVGDLRFAAPHPAPGWEGTRRAVSFGPPAPPVAVAGYTQAPAGTGGSGWLTLNVWTPDPGAGGLPVMVWIHGGAYRVGSTSEPVYDAAALAGSGVVVVTVNHRVGMEGFAHLDGAPDNRGLLDQIAALRWVQEEIEHFGGDPRRATLVGQSAGAGAVATLMAAPAAAGLFAAAIAQSVPGVYFTPRLARDVGAELVRPLGRPPSADALRGTDPYALAAAAAALDDRTGPQTGRVGSLAERWGPVAGSGMVFAPVVDGELVSEDPWTALARGAARDVPLLIGHTRDEWRAFLVQKGLLGRIADPDADWAAGTFGPGDDPVSAMRTAFPHADAQDRFVLVQSDWLFRMPSLQLASAHAAGGGATYLYELTYPAPGAGGVLGACHSLDVPLVFGTLTAIPEAFGDPAPQEAVELSQRMRAAWVSMARAGNPGWPRLDEKERRTRIFDDDPAQDVRAYPEEASRALWSRHHFRPLDLTS